MKKKDDVRKDVTLVNKGGDDRKKILLINSDTTHAHVGGHVSIQCH